ncbi:MAG TPA: hypothetical protein VGA56_07625 [Opitutaceae bacterium]
MNEDQSRVFPFSRVLCIIAGQFAHQSSMGAVVEETYQRLDAGIKRFCVRDAEIQRLSANREENQTRFIGGD